MRVVIVGAGLTGLSLAAFLRRVNIDCVVLEQAPYLQANFQLPVTLFANALSCYKAFSFGQIFEDPAFAPETSFGIRNEKGNWMLEMRNRDVQLTALGEDDIIPLSTAPAANSDSIVSRRVAEAYRLELGRVPLRTTMSAGQLKKVLRQFAPEIKLNAKVVDLVPHDGIKGGVHVIMEDGRSEWGDIVVGADGMHSTVRKLLYPGEHVGINSQSLGMTTVDGYVDVKRVPEGLSEQICEYWGSRRSVSFYPLFHHNDGRIAFSATLYEAPKELVQVGTDLSGEEVRSIYRGLLSKEYASFPPELVQLMANAAVAVPTDLLEVPIMPQWYHRRAVLLGEAAHGSIPSFLGQDASLCVEDAALLTTALMDVPLHTDNGFEYAFKMYESVRRIRIERYIRQSRRARRFTSTNFTGLRDGMLRCTPSMGWIAAQQWLSNWSFSSQQLDLDPRLKVELAFRR